jgi:hypothetical protein
VIVYLNDILIYLKTKEKHIKHVIVILETLEKVNMRINGAKSMFHVQRINFHGYILITNGIKIDSVKTAAIRD